MRTRRCDHRPPPEDEELRRSFGGRGPQRHLSRPWQYSTKDLYRLARTRKPAARFYNHISAAEVRAQAPSDVWHDYYKFCFERNPWDRTLSFYWWRRRRDLELTFDELLSSPTIHDLRRTGLDI